MYSVQCVHTYLPGYCVVSQTGTMERGGSVCCGGDIARESVCMVTIPGGEVNWIILCKVTFNICFILV